MRTLRLVGGILFFAVAIAGSAHAAPYSVRWLTPPNPPSASTWLASFDDLNLDGTLETLALNRDSHGTTRIEIRRASDFSLVYMSPNTQRYDAQAIPVSVSVWNIDADAMPELVVTGIDAATGQGALRVYEWSAGAYAMKWERTDLPSQFTLSGADLDGDLDTDITLSGFGSCNIDILDGETGATEWTFAYPYSCTSMPSVGFADVNANGILELIVTDAQSNGWVIESPANLTAVESPVPFRQRALTVGSAFPNPAVRDASVTFDLASANVVEVNVLDAGGRLVRRIARAPYPAGTHTARWDGQAESGRSAAPGVYWIEVKSGPERMSRRMIRLE